MSALAVSADEQPTLYIATFRPADHAVMIFGFHDTGGPVQQVQQPIPTVPPAAAVKPAGHAANSSWLAAFASGPEAPYLALGVAAVAVILLAGVAYFRRGRSRRL